MSQQLKLEVLRLLNTQQLGLGTGGLREEHALYPSLEMVAGPQEEVGLGWLRLEVASRSKDQEEYQADW